MSNLLLQINLRNRTASETSRVETSLFRSVHYDGKFCNGKDFAESCVFHFCHPAYNVLCQPRSAEDGLCPKRCDKNEDGTELRKLRRSRTAYEPTPTFRGFDNARALRACISHTFSHTLHIDEFI